jgi:hypothetical protein
MRDYLLYWRLIMSRAWARSWGAVIERSFWAILRDALFLGVAAYAVFALKGIIAKLHSPVDVRASEWETGLWVVAGLISVAAVFAAYFLIEALFVTPYLVWREQRAAIAAARKGQEARDHVAEELALRKREVDALETQNAIRTAEIQQRDEANDPVRQAFLEKQRMAFAIPELMPDAHLSLIWRGYKLLLEIRNAGIDADFDVRVDLTGTDVPMRDHGLFPAVWLNDFEADTRRIPETVSDWITVYEVSEGAGLYSAYFHYHLGQVINSPRMRYSWCPLAKPEPVPPQPQRVKMIVSANPRMKGGPKTIEFEVCGFDVSLISGEVQIGP